MTPQYEIPTTCWKYGDVGADRSRAPLRAVLKDEELGDWKDFCPLHAATVSSVLLADHEDIFVRLRKEAGQDLGVEAVLTKVDAQGRLLEGFSLESKEMVHSTDSGQAALFCHSCLSMERSEWDDGIQRHKAELSEARGRIGLR